MKAQLNDDFRALFARLPKHVQEQARKNYRLWVQNIAHPSLHFKQIHTHEAVYSVRIGRGYRALGLVEGDVITWFWIGTHSEYDQLIG